jgi:peptide/nickel transport system substrate-binding protein
MRRWILASAMAVAALAAAGCGSSGGNGDQGNGGPTKPTISVAINSGISSIDPAFACNTQYDYWVVKNTYDTLVQYSAERPGPNGRKIVPGLAKSWTISKDGLTYTFKLRDDVTFSSGNPMTADDVVYSLKRVRAKQGCQDYVLTLGDPKSIASIAKIDDHTVQIKLTRRSPVFLGQLTQTGESPVDRKELEQHGGMSKAGDEWLATHAAGTGAYTIDTYQPDSEIVLKARPDYWQGKPKNERVDIKIITDPTTLNTLAQSGESDMTYGLPLKDLEARASGKRLINDAGPYFVYFGMNTKKPPFDDVRVRQAIKAAIDRKAMAARLGYGHVKTFDGPMPPAMPFAPDLPVPDADVAKAKQLIAQTGAAGSTITLDVKSGEDLQREIATIIQASLKEIGLNVKISTLGASAFFDKVAGFKSQAYLIRDGSPFNDPAYFLGFFVKCGNVFNWTQYCNPQVDKLLAQGKVETNPDKRAQEYGDLSRIVADEVPMIPIFSLGTGLVAADSLEGYVNWDDQQPLFWRMSVR